MSKWVTFYKIGFHNNSNDVSSISVMDFLQKIDNIQTDKTKVTRMINNKRMRLFSFYRTATNSAGIVAIPFGKFRTDKPLTVDEQNSERLSEIDKELVEVNSMYYDESKHICLITTNNLGPKHKDIEDYLNSFLAEDSEYKVRIDPIFINKGIEAIRNANMVRSLTISIDLGRGMNDFIIESQRTEESFAKQFKKVLDKGSEQLNGNIVQFTIGMGRDMNASLSIENILALRNSS